MQTGNRGKSYMGNINVTPMVDVMLVLLIIFMVTAPMMMQGVKVNLPKTTTRYIKSKEEPLVLSINRKREVFLENRRIDPRHLEAKIKKIFANRRDKEILLRADKDVPYGFVIRIVASVKRAGINKLGMVTKPLD